jgi:hypothetical protein
MLSLTALRADLKSRKKQKDKTEPIGSQYGP